MQLYQSAAITISIGFALDAMASDMPSVIMCWMPWRLACHQLLCVGCHGVWHAINYYVLDAMASGMPSVIMYWMPSIVLFINTEINQDGDSNKSLMVPVINN